MGARDRAWRIHCRLARTRQTVKTSRAPLDSSALSQENTCQSEADTRSSTRKATRQCPLLLFARAAPLLAFLSSVARA
eukprot:1215753-Pleurochrysis_carterae.AAC.2